MSQTHNAGLGDFARVAGVAGSVIGVVTLRQNDRPGLGREGVGRGIGVGITPAPPLLPMIRRDHASRKSATLKLDRPRQALFNVTKVSVVLPLVGSGVGLVPTLVSKSP